jgi:glycosyltransferase involved in cell wall biosynthesis
VLLEGMAGGAVVVASDIEGYRTVATDDHDAVLVAPDDPYALRVALQRVLDHPEVRDRLVAAGRRRAEALSMAALARRYVELYEAALGARRTA